MIIAIEKDSEGNANILAFGLLPQFIGKGLGGHLLTKAIERAWEMGVNIRYGLIMSRY